MKSRSLPIWTLALALMPFGPPARGADAQRADYGPAYANLQGKVLLDNRRVIVRQFIVEPGQSTGRRIPQGDQLLVFIKGGILRSNDTGRSTLWRDGRVVWWSAKEPPDEGSTNAGATPIQLDLVTLRPVEPAADKAAPGLHHKYQYLNYPNIPGEDLLENDLVIVQRFTVNPGQWEGVHAHHPDMLYIHVRGDNGPLDRRASPSTPTRRLRRTAKSVGCPPST